MAFEFIFLALIEGQASVEVSRYEDATAYYCLQDATKLNSYIRNQYVKVEDLSSVKEMFLDRVSDYEKKKMALSFPYLRRGEFWNPRV